MAKKANGKTGKNGEAADSTEHEPRQRPSVGEEWDFRGHVFKLKGLFGVLSHMGGSDDSVDANDVAMLAQLAHDTLSEMEAHLDQVA
jgi:hypothetical protein